MKCPSPAFPSPFPTTDPYQTMSSCCSRSSKPSKACVFGHNAHVKAFKRVIPKGEGVACHLIPLDGDRTSFKWRTDSPAKFKTKEIETLIVGWAMVKLYPQWASFSIGDVLTFSTPGEGWNGVIMSCKKDSLGWSVLIQNAYNPMGWSEVGDDPKQEKFKLKARAAAPATEGGGAAPAPAPAADGEDEFPSIAVKKAKRGRKE